MAMENKKMSNWNKINVKTVYKNKWLMVDRVRLQLPSGKTSRYYFVRGNPVAAVLGITEDNYVILVKQYRPAIGKTTIDIPGGGIDAGETSIQSARREFSEETGYKLRKLRKLTTFFYDSGRSNKHSTIYVGRAIMGSQAAKVDEFEKISVIKMPYRKITDKIRAGKIIEPTVRLAIMSFEHSSIKSEYLWNLR